MSTSRIAFHVTAADADAELFLVDCDFALVADEQGDRGIGDRTWLVEPGPYKVKARRGTAIREQVVLVRPGAETFAVPHIAFASPIPIPGTAWTHEHHMELARSTWAPRPGNLWITAREWTEAERSQKPIAEIDPSRGLSVLTLDGTAMPMEWRKTLGWEPIAIGMADVPPGPYRLHLDAPDRKPVEMMLTISPECSTQVYLLTETPLPPDKRRVDLINGAITIRLPGPRSDEAWQLEEIARQALIDDRTKFSAFLKPEILKDTATPMLSLFGAHLLVNEARKQNERRKTDPSLPEIDHRDTVARVVERLRSQLGRDHPDVEALALGAGVGNPDYRFTVPPMLRGGWQRVLSESSRREDLCMRDSFAQKIWGQLWGDGPWLLWTEDALHSEEAWTERATLLLAQFLQTLPPEEEMTPTFMDSFRNYFIKPDLPGFPDVAALRVNTPAAIPQIDKERARKILEDPEKRKALVKELGLPMNTIRDWLEKT
ncbi:MAG TPA: hypothetical protein VM733_00205 [Thermoanaerobaculia bacterium]|nr:hypothetical protein [Thermoanaerobaculia bacterium]